MEKKSGLLKVIAVVVLGLSVFAAGTIYAAKPAANVSKKETS